MDSISHILAIPYPGRGHINPMMNLCQRIASRSIQITFIITEEWLSLLATSSLPSNICLQSIPNVIPSELVRGQDPNGFMDAVLTKMKAPFENMLQNINCQENTAILADNYLPWAVALGNQKNIPVYSLFTESAISFSVMYHNDLLILNHRLTTRNLTDLEDENVDYIPGIKLIRISDLHSTCFSKTPLKINTESFSWITKAQCILFTTIYELESHVIDTLRAILPIPIYPIGPSINLTKSIQNGDNVNYSSWLDCQPKCSVLYISFGSFLPISDQQIKEVSIGLRLSGVRYMWVARENLSTAELLGDDNGIMVSWCNQLEVLCHPSIGGFLTHCGWNSTLEGLYAGVPMLTFPLLFDQFPNSKLIVDDWKLGLRVKKQDFGVEKLITREEISKVVQMVMNLDGDESKKIRAIAAEVKATCHAALEKGGSSFANLDAFVRTMNVA